MRILVVEDEKRLAESLRAGLEAEGYAVDVAHDGRDGLWMATESRYVAVILDIMLPGLNGYRVCQRLRTAGCGTPVLMLTAKDCRTGSWSRCRPQAGHCPQWTKWNGRMRCPDWVIA